MMTPPDWTKAASLPVGELARLLDEDRDEVDDNPPLTGEQIAAAIPGVRRPSRGAGRKAAKVMVALRLDPATVEAWRGSGPGWQTRVGEVLAREAPGAKRRTGE